MDVIHYYHNYFHILLFAPLTIDKMSVLYHKTNLNKQNLLPVFNSQKNMLLNQYAIQILNNLQVAPYYKLA